ncbi:MAG TPA: reverse transcriptase domain-containing protein [Candidatus Nanoarchaeia archaeon]|nr:reverse transcriptase domain-containing protein [Candidatus Nanoarchaeia archaeon]
MKTYNNLWQTLCSKAHLYNAFLRARKRKTKKIYVQEFESNLEENLFLLRAELVLHVYHPQPLTTFVIRDPKTRVISKSAFRDRIVHHALVSLLEPLFDKNFIFDSYANRKGKGTLKALQRFNQFKEKFRRGGRALKADIRHYFDEVDHKVLLSILQKKIKDPQVIHLIKIILNHYHKSPGKGMPLGNLTSQFFANVYLNELDQFVKHQMKIEYYLRYVDDFIIFHKDKDVLKGYQSAIDVFLKEQLKVSLHPQKCRIIPVRGGVTFLGFRIFPFFQLLKKVNVRRMQYRLYDYKLLYDKQLIPYDKVYNSLQGWSGYACQGNTLKLRRKMVSLMEKLFPSEVSSHEINRWLKVLE